jgi:hypothetical protein
MKKSYLSVLLLILFLIVGTVLLFMNRDGGASEGFASLRERGVERGPEEALKQEALDSSRPSSRLRSPSPSGGGSSPTISKRHLPKTHPKRLKPVEIRGLVVDPQGRPLPDAQIGFRFPVKANKPRAKVEYRGLRLGSTSLNGSFAFFLDPVHLKVGKVTATHQHFAPQAQTPVLDRDGRVLPFRIQLKEGISFHFYLEDEQKKPLAGLSVDASQFKVDEVDAQAIGGLLMSGLGLGVQTRTGKSDLSGAVKIENWPEGVPILFGVFGRVQGMKIKTLVPRFEVLSPSEQPPEGLLVFLPKRGGRYPLMVVPDRKRLLRIRGRALGFSKEERSQIFAWADYRGSRPLLFLKWKGERFSGTLNLFKGSKETKVFSLLFKIRDRSKGNWTLLHSFGPFDLKTTRSLTELVIRKKR